MLSGCLCNSQRAMFHRSGRGAKCERCGMKNIIRRLFGEKTVALRIKPAGKSAPERNATRRELLTMAVRDTLRKSGIPDHWIRTETLLGTLPNGRETGMHLRLVLTEWEPKLLTYTVALQNGVQSRMDRLDPLAKTWMTGISWRMAPPEGADCPELPAPDYWKEFVAPAAAKASPAFSAREHLRQLFAFNESRFRERDPDGHADFSPTVPMPDPDPLWKGRTPAKTADK
jgi:hypothetical protein